MSPSSEPSAAWSYRLRLAWERRKLAAAETWLRLWGIDGEPSAPKTHRWPPPMRTWKSKRAWLRAWLKSWLR